MVEIRKMRARPARIIVRMLLLPSPSFALFLAGLIGRPVAREPGLGLDLRLEEVNYS